MVYVSIGHNSTGQLLVACPHIHRATRIDMYLYPDGSAHYEVMSCFAPLIFKPSKQSIILWCQPCFENLALMQRGKATIS